MKNNLNVSNMRTIKYNIMVYTKLDIIIKNNYLYNNCYNLLSGYMPTILSYYIAVVVIV